MRTKLVLIRALWQVTFNKQKLHFRPTRILNEPFFMDADINTGEPGELVEECTSIAQRRKTREFLMGERGVKFLVFVIIGNFMRQFS